LGVAAELHVIGCAPDGLPEFVKSYGLLSKDNPEQLEFMHRMYAESDFFLMPTRAEAQGIVFNESAAYGLPVVASDVGGVSAVVRPDWGLLLPSGDGPEPYAQWIASVFHDRPRYDQMAQRARQDFEQRLSSRVYVERLAEIILNESAEQAIAA
jgi:glycosyltransferase involved in cell wall biosynthesis